MSKHLNFTRRVALAGLTAVGGLMATTPRSRAQAFTLPERVGDATPIGLRFGWTPL